MLLFANTAAIQLPATTALPEVDAGADVRGCRLLDKGVRYGQGARSFVDDLSVEALLGIVRNTVPLAVGWHDDMFEVQGGEDVSIHVELFKRALLTEQRVATSLHYERPKKRDSSHVWTTHTTDAGVDVHRVGQVKCYVRIQHDDPAVVPLELALVHYYGDVTSVDDKDWGHMLHAHSRIKSEDDALKCVPVLITDLKGPLCYVEIDAFIPAPQLPRQARQGRARIEKGYLFKPYRFQSGLGV
jgi:hypothetical protein